MGRSFSFLSLHLLYLLYLLYSLLYFLRIAHFLWEAQKWASEPLGPFISYLSFNFQKFQLFGLPGPENEQKPLFPKVL